MCRRAARTIYVFTIHAWITSTLTVTSSPSRKMTNGTASTAAKTRRPGNSYITASQASAVPSTSVPVDAETGQMQYIMEIEGTSLFKIFG